MRHDRVQSGDVRPSLRGFSPGVAVMEAAYPPLRDHAGSATRPRSHRSHLRSVLLQREMTAIPGVVSEVVPKKAPQMALIQDHHMIQQLPPAAPDPSLGHAVLPGTSR